MTNKKPPPPAATAAAAAAAAKRSFQSTESVSRHSTESVASPTRMLSEHQLSKITAQLASLKSASKSTHSTSRSAQTTSPPTYSTPRRELRPGEASFHDEKSYLRAPLNSRLAGTPTKTTSFEGDAEIGSLPFNLQEYAIIEDLLFVMMGVEGRYIIQVDPDIFKNDEEAQQATYEVDETLDASLKEFVSRILPLASCYLVVDNFVQERSRFEFGYVNHALCSAIRGLVKEYLVLIAQLEHQFRTNPSFTLQKLWFYVHPTLNTMVTIANLVRALEAARTNGVENQQDDMDLYNTSSDAQKCVPQSCKGGNVLSILTRRMSSLSGDANAKRLHAYLLSQASIPYFSLLRSWIRHGEICDPYEEFMVEEHKGARKENIKEDFNDSYWEQRYTLREDCIPPFLASHQQKILLAGKYLNVLRECGLQLDGPTASLAVNDTSASVTESTMGYSFDDDRYVQDIEDAYRNANETLLNLLVKGQQLLPRLRSIKHYFFLDQSDFFTHFLLVAGEELHKPYRDVTLTKIQSLLELVLRNPASVAFSDPFKEDLKVEMSSIGVVDQLLRIINVAGMGSGVTPSKSKSSGAEKWKVSEEGATGTATAATKETLTGIESLTFDYTVTFPLSLVISRKALTKYQLIFRQIVLFKHAEQLLGRTWHDHAKVRAWRRKDLPDSVRCWRTRVFGLRSRMLNFVQQFAYYVCFEVLEPNYRTLEADLSKVTTVDQVLQIHSDFLDTCLKQCMLTNAKLLRIFSKIMTACVYFARYTERLQSALDSQEEEGGDKMDTSAERTLVKFEDNFAYHARLLVDALNFYSATETDQFLCLAVRLDYNYFYARQGP